MESIDIRKLQTDFRSIGTSNSTSTWSKAKRSDWLSVKVGKWKTKLYLTKSLLYISSKTTKYHISI